MKNAITSRKIRSKGVFMLGVLPTVMIDEIES
jgi:hypothetical protein